MRVSRVFRLLFRIFIGLLTFSVTIVSFLGGLSAVNILMNADYNIGIDLANKQFEMDFDISGFHGANFSIPFNFTNDGYFDLENLQLRFELAMNYSEVDFPAPGINGTNTLYIFNKTQSFGSVPKGLTGNFNITGLNSDFASFLGFNISKIDFFQAPPIMVFFANLTISLDYSLGMHSLSINIFNLEVFELP
ncbi:MAG: hypothetical protein ACXAAH_14060 [Promethearchaeota archaeon]|jgi:hypothetical protein